MRTTAKLLSGTCLLLIVPGYGQGGEWSPSELKAIPTFKTEQEAVRDCPGDLVVWADRNTGYFYPKARPQFGNTPAGVFTCLKAARQADYWDINPFSPYGNPRAGRQFPIDPSLLEPGV